MSSVLRVAAFSVAFGLCTQDALAVVVQPADASTVDAVAEPVPDAAAVDADTGAPQPDAEDTTADAAGSPSAPDAGRTVVTIPGATGVQFSAPDDSGDDGCNAGRASSGSFATVLASLLAVLGLAWTRRRR